MISFEKVCEIAQKQLDELKKENELFYELSTGDKAETSIMY